MTALSSPDQYPDQQGILSPQSTSRDFPGGTRPGVATSGIPVSHIRARGAVRGGLPPQPARRVRPLFARRIANSVERQKADGGTGVSCPAAGSVAPAGKDRRPVVGGQPRRAGPQQPAAG